MKFAKETLIAIILSFLLAVVAFTPNLYGFFKTPPGDVFLGSGGTDELTHLTWITQAAKGHWLFQSPYFLGERPAWFFHPFYLLVGLFVQVTHLPAPVLFSVLRLPLSFIFFLTVYLAVATFVQNRSLRIPIFLLAALSGGLGWLDFGNPDPDWLATPLTQANFLVEANTFLLGKQDQATMVAVTLLIISFVLFLKGAASQKTSPLVQAGLLSLCLFFIHPFMIVTVAMVFGLFFLGLGWQRHHSLFHLAWKTLKPFGLFFLFGLPASAYYLFLVKNDPTFSFWAFGQYQTKPQAWEWLFIFGFLLLFLPWGVKKILTRPQTGDLFLITWVTGSWLTAILYPFNFANRMIEGVHLPLAILAGLGINDLLVKRKISSFLVWPILIALMAPASFSTLARDWQTLNRRLADHYLGQNLLAGIGWLDSKASFTETVLAPPYEAWAIAALTGKPIFGGAQGVCFPQKTCQIIALPRNQTPDQERLFLKALKINYFFIPTFPRPGRYSAARVEVFSSQETLTKPYLAPVFTIKDLVIYRVL